MAGSVDVTKCDVLHSVAKIFDPLGLCSPITVMVKCFCRNFGWLM